MRLSLLAGIGFSLAASSVAFAQEVPKLGYVDMQRAIDETEDGRKARASLKKIFDQKQKELDEQQEDLRKSKEDLDKKRSLLGADVVRQKEQELAGKLEKVQQSYMRHQQELQGKQNEAMSKIVDRMQRIIGKIAAGENFTMIFEKNGAGLVYGKPSLDLTNELIRRYNSGEGAAPAGTAKAPAQGGAKPAAAQKK